ncbi:Apc15p protein-domain-containing protein [Aspergillus nidulans var. acristatus]
MISLPLFAPRDSHELWFGPQAVPSSQQTEPLSSSSSVSASHAQAARRHDSTQYRTGGAAPRLGASALATSDTLAALILEERALRARKNNIASFGCSWIKPAGCPKTMLGMKEEEAEREEAMAAADAEFAAAAAAAAAAAGGEGEEGMDEEDETGMERDLDADIPDADEDEAGEDEEGLVEDGEEGLEAGGGVDEEEYMERDLDDDVPEAFADYDDDDEEEDFDNQPDLDDEIPSADEGVDEMSELEQEEEHEERDLDDDIPEADAGEDEWQHTDTDAEFDDEEDVSFLQQSFRTSTASSTRGPSLPQAPVRPRETEAQRRFLQRWSGGGDVFDTSSLNTSMLVDEFDQEHGRDRGRDHGRDLRASLASQTSRRSSGNGSIFGRFPRRRGRSGMPRDNLEF